MLYYTDMMYLYMVLSLSTSPVACYSQPLRSSSTSVVILNDMYRSSDSFVNKCGMLCSSLSELNRKASSGLFERHYGGDGLSQDQNDYRIIEVETGMFNPSSLKAKSVACLRGLAEEEDGGVTIAPPNGPNWVLLHPASADLTEGSRKQKAQSLDELAQQRLKRVVHFEEDSDLHPSLPVSSTHCDLGEALNAKLDSSDSSFVLAPKAVNSVRLVSSKDSGLSDPRFNFQAPLIRRRSLDDIIDLAQHGEKPRGTPRSHSYAALDVIPEDGTFLDDDTLLDSRMESGKLHPLNNTANETHITMETTETIAMATSSGLFDDEAHHGASSTADNCSSLSQPGPLIAAHTSTATEGVTTQEPLSEEGLFSQNATQTVADEQSAVESEGEEGAAAALQDAYQDMMVEGDEGSEASPVSQTSMEGTPPLKIKVSFTIIEEAERKVVKDPSPIRVGGAGGEVGSISKSPQCDKALLPNHGTTSQTGGSPKVGENLPLNTSVSAGEDSDCHGDQSADNAGESASNSVHIIREIFLKQPQGEGDHARKLQPPDRSQQRRKSKEMLAKRWPQLLEEERRWVDGDDDLLLCASVTTLDLTDSETDLQSTSEPNLHTSRRVKVYSGSEGFTDGQTPPGPLVGAGSSDRKQELEDVDWFSGVVTETLQFQMDKQDEVIPDIGGSHFALGNHSDSDDSTSDSTDNSDDDEFVRPSIVSGLDLTSMTPPPHYPTLKNILNHNQMYLPTSGESPYSTGDLPMMSLEHRKVSTKPRMSIIKEEEEALEELIRRM